MTFKSDRQRKKVMSILNPGKGRGKATQQSSSQYRPISVSANIERYRRSANTVPTTESHRNLSDRKTQIADALTWSGCLVISPHACPIIMGVIKAYRIYKIENRNDINREDSKELLKITSSGIGTKLSRNQIENYSNIIVGVTDSSGLTSLISNKTNVNESTIRDMVKGTASNLLENEINTATNFAIDVLV